MMSSDTRKNACRSSVSHPSVARSLNSSGLKGRSRSWRAVSGTEMPLFNFPPGVFALRDCSADGQLQIATRLGLRRSTYLFEPFQSIFGEIVLLSFPQKILH